MQQLRSLANADFPPMCAPAPVQCFLLWFVAQFLFNQSLKLTSVTSNTILSSTSSLFTFALSMIFLREPYSVAKLLSIAACIGGELMRLCAKQRSGFERLHMQSPMV
jgi:solute carrier family 35 protein F5